jgi:shikimate kinase
MIIALIGYRGTGKSTVARELAQRLDWQWVDADEQLEARAGCSIAEIFAKEGEGAFRELESLLLVELLGRPDAVLATGGGVVLREENRQALERADLVVWLKATVETICRRMAEDTTTAARRPNLTTQGGAAEVARLLAEREPFYRQCAQFEVDTEGHSAAEIATLILLNLPRAPRSES